MRLRTLGGLALEGTDLTRPKPLLLLAFLALEGPRHRRELAELFYGDTADPRDGLSTAVRYLRRRGDDVLGTEGDRLWTDLRCDAREVLEASVRRQPERLARGYDGPFLAGLALRLREELDEWVWRTRERLVGCVRRSLLEVAERAAAAGDLAAAAAGAERAYRLDELHPLEPEDLARVHVLLVAGGHGSAAEVAREAEGFGLALPASAERARALVREVFVGRERELERLARLGPGEWAWVVGGPGIGKTRLLRRLDATYLPGRDGLAFATLEPLLGGAVEEGSDAMLRTLLRREGTVAIDDWERADRASRELLARLRRLRSSLGVVVSSDAPAPFPVESVVELEPLPRAALAAHGRAWEATGGVPRLVEAHLRGDPLPEAMAATLSALPATARRVYLALALQDEPDAALVRRALGVGAGEMAAALDTLQRAGLAGTGGQVWPREAARAYLRRHPRLEQALALAVARVTGVARALPLYRRARPAWEEADRSRVGAAARAWAASLLERGDLQGVLDLLEGLELEPDPETRFLAARALERQGRYREALERTGGAEPPAPLAALRANLLWRTGRSAEAEALARACLDGDAAARALALDTLGELHRSRGEYGPAVRAYRRAATAWRSLGRRTRWVYDLNNIAVALWEEGRDPGAAESAYREAQEAAGDDLLLRLTIEQNLAIAWEAQGRFEVARRAFEAIIEVAARDRFVILESRAWNNLGLAHENRGDRANARAMYERALELAQVSHESYMIGVALANLAGLDGDEAALREAIVLLARSGHAAMADLFRREHFPDEGLDSIVTIGP